MQRSIRSLAGVVAAAGLLLSAACSSSDGSPTDSASASPTAGSAASSATANAPLDELRLGVANNLALAAGYGGLADDAGLRAAVKDLTIDVVQNPDDFRTNLAAGRFDVALLPVNIAANLANRDVDVRLVGVVPARLLAVVGPAGLTDWDGLRGQTVHSFFRGDVADLIFKQTAEHHGLIAGTDYTIEYHATLPDVAAAIAGGTAAYAVLPQPLATIATGQAQSAGHGASIAFDLGEQWATSAGAESYPGIGVVTSGALLDGHPAVVDALVAAIERNIAAVVADPASQAPRLAELTGVPAPVADRVLPTLGLQYVSATEARTAVEAFLQALLDRSPEAVGGRLPDDGFFAR